MTFKEIIIGEFSTFVESHLYKNFRNIPITKERALSQYNNPNADKEDIGLILALDSSNEVIGYIGILPEKIYWKGREEKFYWNSCWWVDPVKGKKAAMPLFYQMLKYTGKKQFFFELTPKTKQVIERLSFFKTKIRTGHRLFIRFYLAEIFTKKNKLKGLATVFMLVDIIGNACLYPWHRLLEKKGRMNYEHKYQLTRQVDEEAAKFIRPFLENQVIQRGKDELNWILGHPWLVTEKTGTERQDMFRYYFSYRVKSFHQYVIKLFEENQMTALLLITERDGHFSVPYIFCHDVFIPPVMGFIRYFLIKKRAKTFISFHPGILSVIRKNSLPAFYTKRVQKHMAFPAGEYYDGLEDGVFQDGDGDVVFTG